MNWEAIITILGTVGSLEGIKWIVHYFINHKAIARKEEADTDLHEADAKVRELEAEKNQWELFKDMISELQKALLKKDEVIARKDDVIDEKDRLYGEQTARLRVLQDKYDAKVEENVLLKAKVLYLEFWRCENGDCYTRIPPRPQLKGLRFDPNNMPIVPDE